MMRPQITLVALTDILVFKRSLGAQGEGLPSPYQVSFGLGSGLELLSSRVVS